MSDVKYYKVPAQCVDEAKSIRDGHMDAKYTSALLTEIANEAIPLDEPPHLAPGEQICRLALSDLDRTQDDVQEITKLRETLDKGPNDATFMLIAKRIGTLAQDMYDRTFTAKETSFDTADSLLLPLATVIEMNNVASDLYENCVDQDAAGIVDSVDAILETMKGIKRP